jgi:hypothetical protein
MQDHGTACLGNGEGEGTRSLTHESCLALTVRIALGEGEPLTHDDGSASSRQFWLHEAGRLGLEDLAVGGHARDEQRLSVGDAKEPHEGTAGPAQGPLVVHMANPRGAQEVSGLPEY